MWWLPDGLGDLVRKAHPGTVSFTDRRRTCSLVSSWTRGLGLFGETETRHHVGCRDERTRFGYPLAPCHVRFRLVEQRCRSVRSGRQRIVRNIGNLRGVIVALAGQHEVFSQMAGRVICEGQREGVCLLSPGRR